MMRVSEAGGEPEWLTLPDVADSFAAPSDRWPDFLPGDYAVIFTSTETNSDYTEAEIAVLSLEDKSRKTLVKGGTFGRFIPPGFLVYARENTLFAARFDPIRLELTGPAVPVLEEVNGAANYGSKHMDFSDNGTLLYLPGSADYAMERLTWFDREGNEESAASHERDYGSATISPDGSHVALEIHSTTEDQTDIWILELERDTLTRLTFDESPDTDPIWSPDGEWIVFSSVRDDPMRNLYRKRSNGTGEVERLTTSDRRQIAGSWTADGKLLAFTESSGDTRADLMFYRPGAQPEVEPFLATPFGEWNPQISPDGRWVACGSNESGGPEIYVRPMSGGGGQVKVSTDGGVIVRWSPDGKELVYRNLTGELMSVSFAVEDGVFRPALPRKLFDYPVPPLSFTFHISPDGQRFLTYKDLMADVTSRREPTVVINWFDELESKVPAPR